MKYTSKIAFTAVFTAVLGVAQLGSAAVIDNFSTVSSLQRGPVGTSTQDTASAGAIGGNRATTVTVTSTTNNQGVGAVDVNGSRLDVSSSSGIDASFTFAYGTTGALNQNFSSDLGFLIRLIQSDVGSGNNSITVTSSGGLTSTASFAVPSLVGLNGGPASPVDILVPFASFVGTATFSDVDTITYAINPPQLGDYQIQLLGTFVPEPAAVGLIAPAGLLLMARRRRA